MTAFWCVGPWARLALLVLSVFLELIAYLPKPWVWMELVKQLMGFLLMKRQWYFLRWWLERFGRLSLPLYALYVSDGKVTSTTVMPQSLTNRIVREAVAKTVL